ncbi:hypothetical protein GCM10027586_20270 [Kineococcus gypseus]|uniref:GNAT family N-acetyltransferase n=1 Tax=Kineococcus gypseus TaxID=1637102 RepID=UPI003D7F0C35
MPTRATSLQVLTTLNGDLREQAWEVYHEAFRRLEVLAVQRHLMTRAEFDAVCADERVEKHLGVDDELDGRVCAFGTFTNHLAAIPLISEAYFAHRWPEHHAHGRVWYIGCLGVHPAYRGSGIFPRMVAHMCAVVGERGGVAGIDVCRHNEEELALPQLFGRLVDAAGAGARLLRLDQQSYWAWEFPSPAGPGEDAGAALVRPRPGR